MFACVVRGRGVNLFSDERLLMTKAGLRLKAIREARKAKGVCADCGEVPVPAEQYVSCGACREKARLRTQQYKERKKGVRKKRLAGNPNGTLTAKERPDIRFETPSGEIGYWLQCPANVPMYNPVILIFPDGTRGVFHLRNVKRLPPLPLNPNPPCQGERN